MKEKVEKSIYLLREMVVKFENPMMLWAGGKDSTVMVHLARSAFVNFIPFPVVFLDTGWQFRETYNYIKGISDLWKFNVKYVSNREARLDGVSPETTDRTRCCTYLKTDALRDYIVNNGIDAVAVGIRHDEHDLRGKEMWTSERRDPEHTRVHPILHWTLGDVWEYIGYYDIPVNPLYSRITDGKKYKSIGCWPCTEPVGPEDEERAGRAQDKEKIMERLRALGYM